MKPEALFTNELSNWYRRIGIISQNLSDVLVTSQDEFLTSGEHIQELLRRAKGLYDLSTRAVGLMAGEGITENVSRLQASMSDIRSYMTESEELTSFGVKALQDVLTVIRMIPESLVAFRKAVRDLNVLSMSTHIESTRLTQSENKFDSLAKDVSKLSVLIESKYTHIKRQSQELTTSIELALGHLLKTVEYQQKQAACLFSTMDGRIKSLQLKQTDAAATSQRISTSIEGITHNINGVIVSLQFHDIVRQQIEHVCEALSDLQENIMADKQHTTELEKERQRNLVIWSRQVLSLQNDLLNHTKDEFLGAVDAVLMDLQQIAKNVSVIAEETQMLAGAAGESGSTFMAETETDISLIVSALQENARTGEKVFTQMAAIAKTVSRMTDFIEEVDEISTEIELIAINAQVRAARTGREGASLGVIAEAIQKLSLETRAHSNRLAEIITQIMEIGRKIDAENAAGITPDMGKIESMITGMKQFLSSLASMNRNVVTTLMELDQAGRELESKIQHAIAFMSGAKQMGVVIEDASEELKNIIEESISLVASNDYIGELGRFDQMAQRYTMESERAIHEAHLQQQGTETQVITDPGETGGSSDDEFDDNIEFF